MHVHTCVSLFGPMCMCVPMHLCLPPWAWVHVCAHALVSPSLGLCACAHAHTHMLPQWWVGIGFVEWAGSHLESLGHPDWHMLKYRRWKDSGQRDQFVNLIELQTTRKPTGFVWNLLGVLRSAQASSGGQPALWGPQGCSLCTVQGREMRKGLVLGGMSLWALPSLGWCTIPASWEPGPRGEWVPPCLGALLSCSRAAWSWGLIDLKYKTGLLTVHVCPDQRVSWREGFSLLKQNSPRQQNSWVPYLDFSWS